MEPAPLHIEVDAQNENQDSETAVSVSNVDETEDEPLKVNMENDEKEHDDKEINNGKEDAVTCTSSNDINGEEPAEQIDTVAKECNEQPIVEQRNGDINKANEDVKEMEERIDVDAVDDNSNDEETGDE